MRRLLAPLLVAAAAPAAALEYRALAEPAILYDAPSAQGKKLFIVARGTPVEVVVALDQWVKVRDASGDLAWVERKALAGTRSVIVTAARAEIRRQPEVTAPIAFEADKDVVLDLVEVGPAGWAKVRHRDGASGFVRVGQIWGE